MGRKLLRLLFDFGTILAIIGLIGFVFKGWAVIIFMWVGICVLMFASIIWATKNYDNN